MKILLTYDVSENKCTKIRKLCNKYLNWIQNSTFEGELTSVKLKELKIKLDKIINKDEDSILIYSVNNPEWMNKEILGINKNDFGQFI